MSSNDPLSGPMAGLSVSGNSGSPPNTPPRSQGTPTPGAPGRKPKRPRDLDPGQAERIYMANKRYRSGIGAESGTSMEAGKTRRRRRRRSKRRKSRRKRKTKRKKRRKSRKRRKTRRRRRKR